ncbi:cobyrinic acid a,c-diamide synthase [Paraburkholderia sp. C35]|uniref:cobyrinic acid a,c-diamide synthase n=1 Tax=Paraburkholderia sp. C35 TaxID=2126993 RepID=UPI000D6A02C5|nr:cobyrinic acid a,c-diamide synthase [Paraburkholderia sp. C35]
MKTIVIACPKGGTGKSTTSLHLAYGLHHAVDIPAGMLDAHAKVPLSTDHAPVTALLDTDPQMSAAVWSDACAEGLLGFPVLASPRPNVDKVVAAMNAPTDQLVIDTAGMAAEKNPAMTSAVLLADLVIIPVQASALDTWALEQFATMIRHRQTVTGGALQAALLITQAAPRSQLVAAARQELAEVVGLPILDTVIGRRKAYAEAAARGRTVFQLRDTAAQEEIASLTREVRALLHPVAVQPSAGDALKPGKPVDDLPVIPRFVPPSVSSLHAA